MIKLVAILMVCMSVVACGRFAKETNTQPDHMILGQIGCTSLGAPLKGVKVYKNWNGSDTTVILYCGDGSVRVEIDMSEIHPERIKESPKTSKGV